MAITKCPFTKEELLKFLNNDTHPVESLSIDDNKCIVTWKYKDRTFSQYMTYEVLNVAKLTGKEPMKLFMEEYKKNHPNQTGCSMPNIPAMLQAWAIEFNNKHK